MTGQVIGTGVDLVENDRVRDLIERWGERFRDRVFLPSEQAYCEGKATPWLYYAGRFAVKEAVSKAFGTGIGPALSWLDIEVVRNPDSGAPSVVLSAHGQRLAGERGVERVLISLSHTRHFAVAHALLAGRSAEGQKEPQSAAAGTSETGHHTDDKVDVASVERAL
jgi:holo-[acyl-carrier protein] synthase